MTAASGSSSSHGTESNSWIIELTSTPSDVAEGWDWALRCRQCMARTSPMDPSWTAARSSR